MKGFKNTTKTQMGHGYADEVPTRPATSKDVAAAKAVRIVTPSKPAAKPQPRVTDAMLRGAGEDKAPGERGGKHFAVGGKVFHGSVEYVGKDTNKLDRSAPRINTDQIKNDFKSWGKLRELANHAQGSEAAARLVDAVRADIKEKGWDSHYSWISNSEGKRPTLPSRKTLYGLADKANATAKKASTPEFAARDVRKRDDIPFDGALLTSRGMKRMPSDNDKPKRFAVGGPVRSGGMPAQGKPIMNANDARTAPPMQNGQRPMVPAKPAAKMTNGLPQAWRDGYAADSARRLGANPQPTMRDGMNSRADAARSTPKPSTPATPPTTSYDAKMAASKALAAGYKKGGKVVEKGTGEVYAKGGSPKSKWC
jgi:hypothetical protein